MKFLETFKKDYLKKIENIGNPENLNMYELDILATQYAKDQIRREQKHLKAYLQGRKNYTYLGKKYAVFTEALLQYREEMDAKYLKTKEEE